MSKTGRNCENSTSMTRRIFVAGTILFGVGLFAPSQSFLRRGNAGLVEFWAGSQSGFAIGGYDPVAYFVEGAPRQGINGLELEWGGAFWRFANEGNRAAFRADPGVYSPLFGGHDPVAAGRGSPTQGNPNIWVIHNRRLLLFHSREFRSLWEMDREETLKLARDYWRAIGSNQAD
ncbi:MAG: hypothetical protein JKY32_15500 [Rhizobiales bacterium]|nr:hypothetical protein [Hyphomicrobiales bacterium]